MTHTTYTTEEIVGIFSTALSTSCILVLKFMQVENHNKKGQERE